MLIILVGTPNIAAGTKNIAPKPIRFDILWRKAHARLYSSLL